MALFVLHSSRQSQRSNRIHWPGELRGTDDRGKSTQARALGSREVVLAARAGNIVFPPSEQQEALICSFKDLFTCLSLRQSPVISIMKKRKAQATVSGLVFVFCRFSCLISQTKDGRARIVTSAVALALSSVSGLLSRRAASPEHCSAGSALRAAAVLLWLL